MAIYSWRESIRQGGVLKVFQTESFTGSTWVTELELSIKVLNALLKKHGIRLNFETTATRADASPAGTSIEEESIRDIPLYDADLEDDASIPMEDSMQSSTVMGHASSSN